MGDNYIERNTIGKVNSNGAGHLDFEGLAELGITICNEFRDDDGTAFVILQSMAPPKGIEFVFSIHQARAVAQLLEAACADIEYMMPYTLASRRPSASDRAE